MTLDGHTKVGLTYALLWSVGFTTLYPTLEGDVIYLTALAILFGTWAPDFLEIRLGSWQLIPHRTYTHWWPVWLLGIGACYGMSHEIGTLTLLSDPMFPLTYLLPGLGFCLAAWLHLLCDWPYYGGIPYASPRSRLPLFKIEFEDKANRWFEYAMVWTGIALLIASQMDLSVFLIEAPLLEADWVIPETANEPSTDG